MKFLVVCFIVFAALLTLGEYPPAIVFFKDLMPDEYQHAMVYALFSALLCAALLEFKKPLWPMLPVVAVMGALDEWHQSFVPGRNPDIKDWAVDVAAALVVLGCAYLFVRLRQMRVSSKAKALNPRLK